MSQPVSPTPKLAYNVKDLAVALGIGRSMAYNLVRSGTIRAKQVGDRWIVPQSAVTEFLEGER